MSRARRRAAYGLALAMLAGGAWFVLPRTGERSGAPDAASSAAQAVPPASSTPAGSLLPAMQTSVGLYLKSVTVKKYGWVARATGKRDRVEDRTVFDPRKSWWENPVVLYREPPIADPDVAAGVDCGRITGGGLSSNVEVWVTLIGHAVLSLKTTPRSDCMSGTITVALTGSSRYYDDDWTPLFEVKDLLLVFAFDTRDRTRPMRVTGTDRRTVQVFFECYRRETRTWSPKGEWPETRERADTQTVFYARDATLEVTGYRYDGAPPASPRE